MKTYLIPSPEKLHQAEGGMKWEYDRKALHVFAEGWKSSGQQGQVILEMGKSAQIFWVCDGKRKPLGTMILAAAKEYIKGLVER